MMWPDLSLTECVNLLLPGSAGPAGLVLCEHPVYSANSRNDKIETRPKFEPFRSCTTCNATRSDAEIFFGNLGFSIPYCIKYWSFFIALMSATESRLNTLS
jgi:hypothetical protein